MNLKDKVKELSKTTPLTEGSIAESLMNKAERGLKLDLQYFADNPHPDGGEEDKPSTDDNPNPDSKNPDGKQGEKETFTKSEVDRQISHAIESFKQNQAPKQQEAINQAVKDALAEQQRLSKLSEKERQEEELTQREKTLQEREAKIKRAELRSDAVDDLQKKGLPSDFADILLGDDAESTLANIKTFKDAFDSAVNDAVKEKLRQDTPPAGGSGFSTTENLGKRLAKLNKQGSIDVEKAQGNYFK
ncbi:DUF4355 domain-containing protein [Ralstonia pickettii]|nr:DUF4355 domain-containing protein [Ralstonia pickettii]